MVEKFKTILEKMAQEKGEATFFGIMQYDDLVEKWSVILCAPWVTDANHDEMFRYVFQSVRSVLEPTELNAIARIEIFPKNEHLIQRLLQFKAGASIENQKVNGNVIYHGYVLASNQDA